MLPNNFLVDEFIQFIWNIFNISKITVGILGRDKYKLKSCKFLSNFIRQGIEGNITKCIGLIGGLLYYYIPWFCFSLKVLWLVEKLDVILGSFFSIYSKLPFVAVIELKLCRNAEKQNFTNKKSHKYQELWEARKNAQVLPRYKLHLYG